MATRCQRRAAGRARRRACVNLDGARINTPTPEQAMSHHCKQQSVYHTVKGTKVVREGWGRLVCYAQGALSDKAAGSKRGTSVRARAAGRHLRKYEKATGTAPDSRAQAGPWCHETANDDGQRTLHRMITGGTDVHYGPSMA